MLDRLDLDRPNLVKEKMLFLLAEEDEEKPSPKKNKSKATPSIPKANSKEKISLEQKLMRLNQLKRISCSMPALFNESIRDSSEVLKKLS